MTITKLRRILPKEMYLKIHLLCTQKLLKISILRSDLSQRTLTVGTAGPQFYKSGLAQGRQSVLFVCSESKLVKLETSRTVILPPMVSVLCHEYLI